MSNEEHAQIVIVRRHGDHEEGHHGGAWKIAFADFMTALMALFLVLWLISSTNEDTKVSLARYFNPVKLVDMSPVKKGMADPSKADGSKDGHEDPHAAKEDEHKPAKVAKAEAAAKPEAPADPHAPKPAAKAAAKPPKPEGSSGTGGPVDAAREAALFRDPYAVLAGIAAADQAQSDAAKNVNALGFSGTLPEDRDAFDDPFATDTQSAKPAVSTATQPSSHEASGKSLVAGAATDAKVGAAAAVPGARVAEAAQMQADIAKLLPKSTPSRPEPAVEVRATKEGLLISLTDDALFSMFSVGSAEPQGPTVEAMAKVAALLKTRSGGVVIRGFTDARPYKSAVYDNWRLSSSRAHMAQYMLIRGGLDEKRIESVEGYADRHPKITQDPMAPQNRRIEILVRAESAL